MLDSEIIITSHKEDGGWNCGIWSSQQNGPLLTYRGGSTRPHCLAMIGSDYLISGVKNSDVLKIWPISIPDAEIIEIACPGPVTALSVSADGKYCAGAIDSKIFFWKVTTGRLMNILSKHWDTVTCLKFSCDGLYLVSGGNDKVVMAWKLSSILSSNTTKKLEPYYLWTDHCQPIVAIYINRFAPKTKVVTISRTLCKVYSLEHGKCITTFATTDFLFSVTMGPIEAYIFLGNSTGDVIQFEANDYLDEEVKGESMISRPRTATFNLHKNAITCLSVSEDGELLLTGSMDGTALLWDIHGQNIFQILEHSGPISNAFFTPCPPSFVNSECLLAKAVVKPFEFHIVSSEDGEREWELNLSPSGLKTLKNIDEDEKIPIIDEFIQDTHSKELSDTSILTYLMNFTSQERLQNVISGSMY